MALDGSHKNEELGEQDQPDFDGGDQQPENEDAPSRSLAQFNAAPDGRPRLHVFNHAGGKSQCVAEAHKDGIHADRKKEQEKCARRQSDDHEPVRVARCSLRAGDPGWGPEALHIDGHDREVGCIENRHGRPNEKGGNGHQPQIPLELGQDAPVCAANGSRFVQVQPGHRAADGGHGRAHQ